MDGRTFFETAKNILNCNDSLCFQRIPYALIINKGDRTIDYDFSMKIFRSKINDLLIVHSESDHYPVHIEESYFMSAFPKDEIDRIIAFFNSKDKV